MILWRYLLKSFLYPFFFSLGTFIIVLLIIRLEEIAHFAALSASPELIFKYALYQIPYIIPITVPLSCLIAAVLLFQKISVNEELTALRSCGYSIGNILMPIMTLSIILSMLNFYFISEISTTSHLSASLLKKELRSVNPLLLLHNKHLMRSKGYFFETLGSSKIGETAHNILLAMPNNEKSNRINLLLSKKFISNQEHFTTDFMTLISDLSSKFDQSNDFILENINHSLIGVNDFTKLIDHSVWNLNNDHLTFSLLLTHLYEKTKMSTNNEKQNKMILHKGISEILKRISVGLSPFTFSLMGAIFGISVVRNPSNLKMVLLFLFTSIYLICFFSAKAYENNYITSAIFYFVPHLLILASSMIILKQITAGKTYL